MKAVEDSTVKWLNQLLFERIKANELHRNKDVSLELGKTLKDDLIDTIGSKTDRFDWKYRHTVDHELREVRET